MIWKFYETHPLPSSIISGNQQVLMQQSYSVSTLLRQQTTKPHCCRNDDGEEIVGDQRENANTNEFSRQVPDKQAIDSKVA